MTVTYLGGITLGDAIPGLKDSLDIVGGALQTLRAAINANSALLQSGIDAVTGAMSDLEAAKDSFVGGPIGLANSKIDAAQGLLDEISSITDASAYLAAALAGIDAGRALIAGIAAPTYLSDQITAVNAGVDGLQGEANALVATADDMTDVTQLTAEQMAAVQNVKNAIDQAAQDALVGVVAYVEQISQLAASGIHALWYQGQLSSLGSEVDAALPETGLSGSTVVAGPLLVVDTANTAGLAALEAVFGA